MILFLFQIIVIVLGNISVIGAEASDSVSLNNCPDNEDKPLKLVLKVGPQETGDVFNPQSQTEEKIKHRHKKKKKRKDEKLRGREVTLKEVGR